MSQFSEAADTASFYLSEAQIMPDGEEYICDEDLASFLIYCIDETTGGNWADFESALGKIEWEYFFDELEDIKDRDGDINLWKTASKTFLPATAFLSKNSSGRTSLPIRIF